MHGQQNVKICSLSYSVCNALAPYCHLRSPSLYNIFPHYLINGTIVKKKIIEHKICVLSFLATFFLKHFSFEEEISEI